MSFGEGSLCIKEKEALSLCILSLLFLITTENGSGFSGYDFFLYFWSFLRGEEFLFRVFRSMRALWYFWEWMGSTLPITMDSFFCLYHLKYD